VCLVAPLLSLMIKKKSDSKWPLFYVKIVYASGRAITPATLLIVDLGEYTSVKFNSCTKHAMSVTSNGFSWLLI
jgi:hypothetical protein